MSLSTLGLISLFDFNHSSGVVVASQCGLNFHIPDS